MTIELLTALQTEKTNEVAHLQFNINNLQRAIVKANTDPELSEYAIQLTAQLAAFSLELKKQQLLLSVATDQLEELAKSA